MNVKQSSIQDERIQKLNDRSHVKGKSVIYWMQASQRTRYNHALEYAALTANQLKQPLIVYFGLTSDFPEANLRHYRFMLEGLREVKNDLKDRGIFFCIRQEQPVQGIISLAKTASAVIVDRGYLKIQKQWRNEAASNLECPLIQVESDCVVPVETASAKEEYSAATLRPKIHRLFPLFLKPLDQYDIETPSLDRDIDTIDIDDIETLISKMKIDRSAGAVERFKGGTGKALKNLDDFIETKLESYPEKRNDPNEDVQSHLSPYLHFGQISPLDIALRTLESGREGTDVFLEELVIRRELSLNFVNYNRRYDTFTGLPEWARKTLNDHRKDKREYIYPADVFEQAGTHDELWNAAQIEMNRTGKMHGYMRMYWAKKILEWTKNPEEAIKTSIYLNDKYELDGRDPNGYTGIAWSIGGVHDRPWFERPVFGLSLIHISEPTRPY